MNDIEYVYNLHKPPIKRIVYMNVSCANVWSNFIKKFYSQVNELIWTIENFKKCSFDNCIDTTGLPYISKLVFKIGIRIQQILISFVRSIDSVQKKLWMCLGFSSFLITLNTTGYLMHMPMI